MRPWPAHTIDPPPAALQALRTAWHWMLGDAWTPLLFSAIGDVFFTLPAGSVWWLSTATGSLEHVADTEAEFNDLLDTERADEWLLPGLVDYLCRNGQPLAPDQCYSYGVFPIFEEGSFSAENLYAACAATHFTVSGRLHESLRQLPDGTPLQAVLHGHGPIS